mgnify:CR=1 FL=1
MLAAALRFVWNVSPFITLPLGLRLHYYSVFFFLVFVTGYRLLLWQVERAGGTQEEALGFVLRGILAVLIGARLAHVIFYDYAHALRDPLWILQVWTGGLSSHGAVAALVLAWWLYARKLGIHFMDGMDRFSFSAAFGSSWVRLGNFFNSEIVGRPTDQTWGVAFPRYMPRQPILYRHPMQLYELALGVAVGLALVWADRAWGKESRPRGALISLCFLLYFGGRFLLEFFKEVQVPQLERFGFTMGQYLSLPAALLGALGLWYSLKHRHPAGWRRDAAA